MDWRSFSFFLVFVVSFILEFGLGVAVIWFFRSRGRIPHLHLAAQGGFWHVCQLFFMVPSACRAIHCFFKEVSNGLLTFASFGGNFFESDRDICVCFCVERSTPAFSILLADSRRVFLRACARFPTASPDDLRLIGR